MKGFFVTVGSLILAAVIYFAGIANNNISVWEIIAGWAGWGTPTAQVKITPTVVVQQVQQLNQLVTTKYTIQVVVDRGREGTFFGIGKDKILLVAQGRVIAGLDLSQLREQDLQITGDRKYITINLPPIKLLDAYLVEENTFVYQRDTGILQSVDPNLETEARRAALSNITQVACDDGIVKAASENAKYAITELLRTIGFQEIIINLNTNAQCTLLPT